MIRLHRPVSNRGRYRALLMITDKNNSVPLLDRIFTTQTTTQMNAEVIVVNDEILLIKSTKRDLNEQTKFVNEAMDPAVKLIKDFCEGLFKMVKRADQVADVVLYDIPESHLVYPKLTQQSDVKTVGKNMNDGETARVLLPGRVAMSNPTIGEVNTGVGAFNDLKTAQSTFKETYGNAVSAMTVRNKNTTDDVIKISWNEVRTRHSTGTIESQRRQDREYGLVYVSKIMKTFNILVLDNATGLPILAALVELIDTGKEGTTVVTGRVAIKSTVVDGATFNASHDGYNEGEVTIVVSEDILVYNVTIRLTAV
jgi:hypothetical protein